MHQAPRALALIPDGSGNGILMHRDQAGSLVLPAAQCDEVTELTGKIVAALRSRWGITAPFLRSPAKSKRKGASTLWLCEFAAVERTPHPQLEWVDIDRAESQADLPPTVAAAIRLWLEEQHSGIVPRRRAAWARPGWYESMRTWIAQQLSLNDIGVDDDPVMVQQWGISAVYRQPTTNHGDYYFKAVFGAPGRGFWHEPAVTERLAVVNGKRVTSTLAIDRDRGWMLMPDIGVSVYMAETDADTQVDGLLTLARLQREWIGRCDELQSLGCSDRGPLTLKAKLPSLITDAVTRLGLTKTECHELESRAEELYVMCDRSLQDPIPPTLMHGDFHTGNAAVRADGSVCIFDWSDAAIGHPFWDTRIYLETAHPQGWNRLRESYLQQWADLAPEPVLSRSFDDASILGALNQVVSYQEIVAGLEENDMTFANGQLHWWRHALEMLREQKPPTRA